LIPCNPSRIATRPCGPGATDTLSGNGFFKPGEANSGPGATKSKSLFPPQDIHISISYCQFMRINLKVNQTSLERSYAHTIFNRGFLDFEGLGAQVLCVVSTTGCELAEGRGRVCDLLVIKTIDRSSVEKAQMLIRCDRPLRTANHGSARLARNCRLFRRTRPSHITIASSLGASRLASEDGFLSTGRA
jgi:hypothetical protein